MDLVQNLARGHIFVHFVLENHVWCLVIFMQSSLVSVDGAGRGVVRLNPSNPFWLRCPVYYVVSSARWRAS